MNRIARLIRRDAGAPPAQPLVAGRPARVPPGLCVYAIGDVHGRLDCLRALHDLVREDAAGLPRGTEKLLVYLGDYVDRGPDSRAVLDVLIAEPLPGFRSVHLMGNHDAWLLAFLEDTTIGPAWLRYGGDATLQSYGIATTAPTENLDALIALQGQLRARLPLEHIAFIEAMPLSWQIGDYLFVHAGVRPGLPLTDQQPEDLLWIREPFLSTPQDLGKVVVHGHTVTTEPEVRTNRIGVDTGACWSGRLTCAVLDRTSYRFLTTSAA